MVPHKQQKRVTSKGYMKVKPKLKPNTPKNCTPRISEEKEPGGVSGGKRKIRKCMCSNTVEKLTFCGYTLQTGMSWDHTHDHTLSDVHKCCRVDYTNRSS